MVHFVGAGPGAPDLITQRGAALLRAVWPQLVQSGWGVWLVTDIPLYGVAAPAAAQTRMNR